jgi:hypothetical protein
MLREELLKAGQILDGSAVAYTTRCSTRGSLPNSLKSGALWEMFPCNRPPRGPRSDEKLRDAV